MNIVERLRKSYPCRHQDEDEKDSSESIRPFLLGAMDNAKKILDVYKGI